MKTLQGGNYRLYVCMSFSASNSPTHISLSATSYCPTPMHRSLHHTPLSPFSSQTSCRRQRRCCCRCDRRLLYLPLNYCFISLEVRSERRKKQESAYVRHWKRLHLSNIRQLSFRFESTWRLFPTTILNENRFLTILRITATIPFEPGLNWYPIYTAPLVVEVCWNFT